MPHSNILNAAGERLDVTFHPGTKHDTLVILGHGVTGNKDRPLLVELAEALAAAGWPCLRISFSGNGQSGGRYENATITKETKDLKAVLDTVPDYVRVAYIGHSMGAAAGIFTAANDVRINVLISLAGMTFTKDFLAREFGHLTPGASLMWDEPGCPFSQEFADDLSSIGDTLTAAANVFQPWLFLHGEEDDVVPLADGIAAHAAAPGTKHWVAVPGAGHSFENHRSAVISETLSWLQQHLD